MFFNIQNESGKNRYIKLLSSMGKLSKLFNDGSVPFLQYRAHENIFCQSFHTDNLSRSDVSYDTKFSNIGIGLKTFLHGNGNTYQKVAEFNALSTKLRSLEGINLAKEVAKYRNARIETTNREHNIKIGIYHCLTRLDGEFRIYEYPLEKINIQSLVVLSETEKSLTFTDKTHEYNFNRSKSTLFKRFILTGEPLATILIETLENPYRFLLNIGSTLKNEFEEIANHENLNPGVDFICLPLYAPSSNSYSPADHSGLNQWNAKGRQRDPNEVYIPIPSWIHKECNGFLPNSNNDIFEITLPTGEVLSAKLCQSGSKGLMSNPNKALGKWLLRDLLQIQQCKIVTRENLELAGIDSIFLYKISSTSYKINFAALGKFEEFKKNFFL